jgi:hypothetical protein
MPSIFSNTWLETNQIDYLDSFLLETSSLSRTCIGEYLFSYFKRGGKNPDCKDDLEVFSQPLRRLEQEFL